MAITSPDPATQASPKRNLIIDADVHCGPQSNEAIVKHMKEPWRKRYMAQAPSSGAWYRLPGIGMRADAKPANGRHGSDPELTRKQLIDEYGIAHAILLPRSFCTTLPDYDYANAIAAAFNHWMDETWLGAWNHDGVFKGALCVATQDPQQAAREIEKWAGHPHFIEVMVDSGARLPYGNRYYWPIYEACARHNLPFAIHVGTEGMGINEMPTPGAPSHYIEWATNFALSYQAHLVSFITEGVFEKFPNFKLALKEGGSAWLAPILWRLDSYWRSLRHEVPWMKRRPHEYVRDHIRFSSQPLEAPDSKQHLLQIFEMMDAEHVLMFASDYPHYDFDSPTHTFPKMNESMRNRIFYENAREFYNL